MSDMATVRLEHVLGDTWCIVTGHCRIPLYMPDRAEAIMIDSGLKHPDREGILTLLDTEKIHVATLLTSHIHPDHIGNHMAIKDRHNCAIYMPPYSAVAALDTARMIPSGYENYAMPARHFSPCVADRVIPRDAASITVSGAEFPLLWLHGHAVEQVGFVTPDGVAYLGDTLLSDHVLRSVRLPYYNCCRLDMEAKESLRDLACPGYILAHNEVCSEIGGLIDRNLSAMGERLALVERLAAHWMPLEQLCATVMEALGTDLNSPGKVIGSKRNIQVLVKYLAESGRLAVRVRQGYVEYIAAENA